MPFYSRKPTDDTENKSGESASEMAHILDPTYRSPAQRPPKRGELSSDLYRDGQGQWRHPIPAFPLINPEPPKTHERQFFPDKFKKLDPEPLPPMNQYPLLPGKKGPPRQFPRSGYELNHSPPESPPNYIYKPGDFKSRPVLNVQKRRVRMSNPRTVQTTSEHQNLPQSDSKKTSATPDTQVTSPEGANIPVESEDSRN